MTTFSDTMNALDRATGYTTHARPNNRGRKQIVRNLMDQFTVHVVWIEGKTNIRHEETLGEKIFDVDFGKGAKIAYNRACAFSTEIDRKNCRRKYKHVIESITIEHYSKDRKTSYISVEP